MIFKKFNKNLLLIFICGILVFYSSFCFSADLEVKYPVSQSGIVLIDTSTPIPIFLKYLFDIGMFLGFMAAVYSLGSAGIFYLMSPAKPELLSLAKDRVAGAISGVLILIMIYLIITTLNPQLAFLNVNDLDKVPTFTSKKIHGVYFYKSNDCSGDAKSNTININDFGTELSNQINSVLLVNSPDNYYFSTLYSSPGLFGKCLDIDPNNYACQPVANIASSASIHSYEFNPKGDGVYLYRKPFYNTDGGWLKITNSQIIDNGFFGEELKNLTFIGDSSSCNVSKEEQICEKWDERGNCTQKKCPTLAEKEISSIKIMGNYIVYFVYLDPADTVSWSYCQEFPTPDDVNREGPKQFKWEKTPNQKYLPNWLYIYPVKEK
jgi:hypothetical protein